MSKDFEISYGLQSVDIEKEGKRIRIEKRSDGDVWFYAPKNTELTISGLAWEADEFQCYPIFERLVFLLVGREAFSPKSIFTKDFVDTEKKMIHWVSESDANDTLQIQFKNKEVALSLRKNPEEGTDEKVCVRVRSNGSAYGLCYKDFQFFYKELAHYATTLHINRMATPPMKETPKQKVFTENGNIS